MLTVPGWFAHTQPDTLQEAAGTAGIHVQYCNRWKWVGARLWLVMLYIQQIIGVLCYYGWLGENKTLESIQRWTGHYGNIGASIGSDST